MSKGRTEQVFEYDVALSFAGEERDIASRLAKCLRSEGVKVFYDEFEKAELWGKNLYDHLAEIYTNKARLCVMIVSRAYVRKAWTTHERQSAQSRDLHQGSEYILPIKVEDVEVPGLASTVGYLTYPEHSIRELTQLVVSKLHPDEPVEAASKYRTRLALYEDLGASIPPDEFAFQDGQSVIKFKSWTGTVLEVRGEGDHQEVWLNLEDQELSLTVPRTMLRARRGHFASCVKVVSEQHPPFLVAAMNFDSRHLMLAGDELKYLAAMLVVGEKKADYAIDRVGKAPWGRSIMAGLVVMFLSALLTDYQWVHWTMFFLFFGLFFAEPYYYRTRIKKKYLGLAELVTSQFGTSFRDEFIED